MKGYSDEEGSIDATTSRRHDANATHNVAKGVRGGPDASGSDT
jgi:hypothetical protein